MSARPSLPDQRQADNSGSQSVRDELMGRVYDELRRLAHHYLREERPNHTLQPTALVHEAYLRLMDQPGVSWRSREHFIGIAATMMRRVLVDHARRHKRDKRGGGLPKLSLLEADCFTNQQSLDFVALDVALGKLSTDYPDASRTVELRFFGGLSIAETARVLSVSESTVERDWRFARAWLMREMNGSRGL